jgi:hypothetical protein
MQLRFLGAEYACRWPEVKMRQGAVEGKYRGVCWNSKHYSTAAVPTRPVTLHFMGRAYEANI